jgi:hypothetical protein
MASRKPSMRGALKRSMEDETRDFDRRFEQAEQVLGSKPAKAPPVATPEPVPATDAGPAPPVERVVRDSFTMPQSDHDLLQILRERCLKGGVAVTKSELVRVALRLLHARDDRALLEAVQSVEKVPTGRPKR